MSVRTDIAAALSTVDGVQGFLIRPQSPRQGDSWPKRQTATHVAPGAWETSWQIVVLAPTDEAAQDAWIDTRIDDLAEALAPVVHIDSIDLGTSSDSPAFLINCRE